MLVTTRALRTALERSTSRLFPDDAVLIAPNGVDFERYAGLLHPAAARQALGLPDCVTAGFTGHFYEGRGMDLLFALARDLPEVNFLWVGGTVSAVEQWRSRLEAAGTTNIVLTGFVDNSVLPSYQAAADVLLMPYGSSVSSSSGQDIADVINPMKMFEYMAAGRAILNSDLPVFHEVLNEANALFCPPEDERAWQEMLGRLLEDGDLRLRLGEQAQRDSQQYTWLSRAKRSLDSFAGRG